MSATDYKPAIVDALTVLEQSDTARGERFAAAAYKKILGQLKSIPAIHSFEDLAGVQGIGVKMRAKLAEIFETGKLASAEHAKANPDFLAYNELLAVYGVGPVKAKKFVEAGVQGVADLRARAAADPTLLTAAQKLGLQFYEDGLERIPRAEIDEHRTVLEAAFRGEGLEMEIVGSYRRGAANSGDIDVLVTAGPGQTKKEMTAAFKKAVDGLEAAGYLRGILARGPTKTLAYSSVTGGRGRRLDLLLTDPAEYAYAIVYFTGSDQFNIAMRAWALDHGYTMNEHSMQPISDAGPAPPMRSERDIFDFLGLAWVPPTERRDSGAVSPALSATSTNRTQVVAATTAPPAKKDPSLIEKLRAKKAAAAATKI